MFSSGEPIMPTATRVEAIQSTTAIAMTGKRLDLSNCNITKSRLTRLVSFFILLSIVCVKGLFSPIFVKVMTILSLAFIC
jgi:hypothetical protein